MVLLRVNGLLDDLPRLGVDLELVGVELGRSTQLDCDTLHDELLSEHKVWVRAQSKQDVLLHVRVPNALEDALLVLL